MGNEFDATNGNGSRAVLSLPTWVKAIAIIGIPGVIALYTVWMQAQTLPRMEQELLVNRTATEHNAEMLREHHQQTMANYRLLIHICANTAKNPVERSQCFDVR